MRTESTPGARGPVFCGVDTHADSHWLHVLDWRGRKVLSRRFPADAAGYEALAGGDRGGRGAGLRRDGGDVVLRGGPHQAPRVAGDARARGALPGEDAEEAPGQGKCDEADAERAARAAMSGSKLGTPKSQDGWVDGVRACLRRAPGR